MKASERYFPVALFIMLYKVVMTSESANEILKSGHISNESYWAVLSCGAVYYAVQGGSNFWVWMKSLNATIQMKPTEQYFLVVMLIPFLYKVEPPRPGNFSSLGMTHIMGL